MTVQAPGQRDGASARWIRLERSLAAPNERVFRVWTDPEELPRWLPDRVEGSLAPGTRSVLLWRRLRVWWDVVTLEPNSRIVVRMPWTPDESVVTSFTIALEPEGYGTRLRLEDGPFPIDSPEGFDAYVRAVERWADALAALRAYVDFSVDLRNRS